jgi:hypothetical protein
MRSWPDPRLRPTFSFRRRNEAKAFGDADRAVDNAATQNKVTQSCGLSFVVGFSMIYPEGSCWFRSGLFSAVVWPTHGRVMVIAAAAVHRERPRDRCAAEQRDELAALHGFPPQDRVLTLPHRCARTLLCITAKLVVEWQRWVILGHSAMSAQCPGCPKADNGPRQHYLSVP